MKSSKLISLSITMLFSLLTFGQEKTITIKISDSIIHYKINADFNILKLRGEKVMNISDDAIIIVNDSIYSDNQARNLNVDQIKEINIFKGAQGNGFICDGSGKNYIINIYKIAFKKNTLKLEEKTTECIGISRKRIALKDVTIVSKEDIEKVTPKPEKTKAVLNCERSIKDTEKPLWVVNGFISTEKNSKELNPDNIKSVNVLKGEQATALYGSKGVNGVILITTQNLTKKELRKLKRKSERDYEKEEKEKIITPLQSRI